MPRARHRRSCGKRGGRRAWLGAAASGVLLLGLSAVGAQARPASKAVLPLAAWQDPPRDVRPVARWWWPGGSVTGETIHRELQRIRAAGFGAVEVQPLLLGLGAEDLAADPKLRSVGEPSFRRAIAAAASAAAEIGVDFDFTLGSGWPGGLPTARINSERQLVMGTRDVRGPMHFRGALPAPPDQSYRRAVEWILDVLGPPDPNARLVAVLAARMGAAAADVPILEELRVLHPIAGTQQLDWNVPAGRWRIFALYENATDHFVMGGAYPGAAEDALVVDHLSTRGADALLEGYAAPMLDGLAPGRVREVFIDSFELMGELPFTSGLPAAFRGQAGYDITPLLPLLFLRGGESKYGEMIDWLGRNGGPLYESPLPGRRERIREDYEAVRAKFFEERFVSRFARWARQRGLALRLQAHGGYGDILDTYARADVPESEGLYAGGSFDFLKLASSAAHVAGRRFASSESFITLRLFGTRLSWDEMRLLAGRAYSAGINRLTFHGVPYPYTRADGKAWYPFSGGFGRILAGPLPMSSQIDTAFLAALPEFNRFVARLSVAMSSGAPHADVAWLHADRGYPDATSLQLGRIEAHAGESPTTRALRARGLFYDRVSRHMLRSAKVTPAARATDPAIGFSIGEGHYRALLLDPLEVASPELSERIAEIAEAGIPVLSLGPLPQRAPGLADAAARDRRVRAACARISRHVIRVPAPERLARLLARYVGNDLVEPEPGGSLGVSLERRHNARGDTLLLVNESWSSRPARLRFLRAGRTLTLWDPWTGARKTLRKKVALGDIVEIPLGAGESKILTLRPAIARDSGGL